MKAHQLIAITSVFLASLSGGVHAADGGAVKSRLIDSIGVVNADGLAGPAAVAAGKQVLHLPAQAAFGRDGVKDSSVGTARVTVESGDRAGRDAPGAIGTVPQTGRDATGALSARFGRA